MEKKTQEKILRIGTSLLALTGIFLVLNAFSKNNRYYSGSYFPRGGDIYRRSMLIPEEYEVNHGLEYKSYMNILDESVELTEENLSEINKIDRHLLI